MKDDKRLTWVLNRHFPPGVLKFFKSEENIVREYFYDFITKQPNSSKEDFLWSLFQFLIVESSKASQNLFGMYKQLSSLYFKMAVHRRLNEKVKANDLVQLSLECELRSYDKNSISNFKMGAEIIIVKDCCEYCNSFEGKRFDIDEALEKKLYDAEKCTSEKGCRSCYAIVPIRDKNGSLIPID